MQQEAGETKFLFEGKNIERMEILVLNLLKWNMKAYTPFTFIPHFLAKMNDVDNHLSSGPLITRSIQIILSTIKGLITHIVCVCVFVYGCEEMVN